MNQNTATVLGILLGALAVVGVAFIIAWSVNNTSIIHKEKVVACVESGGTWIEYGNLCLNGVEK